MTCTTLLAVESMTSMVSAALFVTKISEAVVGAGWDVARKLRTQSARVSQSGSFCDGNCRPPEWNGSPPAPGARGWSNRGLELGSPGTTNCSTVWKFWRDCSSVQSGTPGDNFWR